eukprot:GEMP01057190.1.p1 GENE.GEMP01057190.1~~GEMP01057190.1.p1  ORF type:complete len:134 (+),score=21.53 GEMP01057190.1:143-544(+)
MNDWLTNRTESTGAVHEPPIRVMQRKRDSDSRTNQHDAGLNITSSTEAAARHRERKAEYETARRRIFGNQTSNNSRGQNRKGGKPSGPSSDVRQKAIFQTKDDRLDPDYDRSRFVVKKPDEESLSPLPQSPQA